MCNKQHCCDDCGDRLIHQFNRGIDESSSALGQLIHDHVTKATTVVDADHQLVDGRQLEAVESQLHQLHFSSDLPRLRLLEHKPIGGQLSRAQRWIMPIWRDLIQLGVRTSQLSTESGVYRVDASPPFIEFTMTKYLEFGREETRVMDLAGFQAWMGGAR